jgi:hypothetical protein
VVAASLAQWLAGQRQQHVLAGDLAVGQHYRLQVRPFQHQLKR